MNNYLFKNRDGNTPLDQNQIDGLLFSHVTTMGELDQLEDENIQKGLAWLNHYKGQFLSTDFTKKLHGKLFGDVWSWAGTFRKNDVNLSKVSSYDIQIELKKLFLDVETWIKYKSISWDEIPAQFHHRLVCIHPFPNGNGRISRIMTEYFEKKNNKPITSWSESLSNFPKKRRGDYIKALQEADRGNINQLIEFMKEKIKS